MTSREKVSAIFNRKSNGEGAMWTGHLNDATVPIFAEAYGVEPTRDAIYDYLGDDMRWCNADLAYRDPEGKPMWDTAWKGTKARTLSSAGCFANVESMSELKDYPWPKAEYYNFEEVYKWIDQYPDKFVIAGPNASFFHVLCEYLGMENYFIKMYEDPEIVEAITERITDFYVEAIDLFFQGLGNRDVAYFFGNDFGTQRDLFLSPEMFRKFLLPSFKRIINTVKKYGKKVMLHSCGSIYRIIPDLIDAGVDALHPIQAQAAGMSADDLKQFKNDIAFVGGIDAQSFFVNATPQQIKDEVYRVRDILGPNIVISPSHEEILPIMPAANVKALAEAAKEVR